MFRKHKTSDFIFIYACTVYIYTLHMFFFLCCVSDGESGAPSEATKPESASRLRGVSLSRWSLHKASLTFWQNQCTLTELERKG